MSNKLFTIGEIVLSLTFEMTDNLKVRKSPRMPCFVPRLIEVRGKKVRVEHFRNILLRWMDKA
jgi:hypothetical protein